MEINNDIHNILKSSEDKVIKNNTLSREEMWDNVIYWLDIEQRLLKINKLKNKIKKNG